MSFLYIYSELCTILTRGLYILRFLSHQVSNLNEFVQYHFGQTPSEFKYVIEWPRTANVVMSEEASTANSYNATNKSIVTLCSSDPGYFLPKSTRSQGLFRRYQEEHPINRESRMSKSVERLYDIPYPVTSTGTARFNITYKRRSILHRFVSSWCNIRQPAATSSNRSA